ncbi:hypothetical protein CCH79_00001581, partial [Gambusia affinis]
ASLHVLVFCLLGLSVLCHSDCFFQELVKKDLTNPPKGCLMKPDISEECGLVVDKDACSAKMVQKSDKTQP